MDVFDLRRRLVSDYRSYTRSFINIRDSRIDGFVDGILAAEGFWPEPLLQLNPTFRPGGTIDDLVELGMLHRDCSGIFRIGKSDTDHRGKQLLLHQHQREAILKAREGRSYVLTTGTGSGKSLAYIVPIVDHVLRRGTGRGIQAIVVYPMNALANSQSEELGKFVDRGYPEGRAPVRFARYTGQERGETREAIRSNPPDILLTNYMMLELLLTRSEDRELVRSARGSGSSCSTSCTPIAAARAPTSRCSSGAAATPSATTSSASARPPPWRAAGAAAIGGSKSRKCPSPYSAWTSRRTRSSTKRWSARPRRSTPRIPRSGRPFAPPLLRTMVHPPTTRRSAAIPSHPGSSRRSGCAKRPAPAGFSGRCRDGWRAGRPAERLPADRSSGRLASQSSGSRTSHSSARRTGQSSGLQTSHSSRDSATTSTDRRRSRRGSSTAT